MELLLESQELLDLGNNLRGTNIICRSGLCWLTQTGDGHDYILRAGDCFKVFSQERLIVTANTDCRLQLAKYAAKVSSGFFRFGGEHQLSSEWRSTQKTELSPSERPG